MNKNLFYGLACKNHLHGEFKRIIDWQQLVIYGRVINDDPKPTYQKED
jgi:hypothetical protein